MWITYKASTMRSVDSVNVSGVPRRLSLEMVVQLCFTIAAAGKALMTLSSLIALAILTGLTGVTDPNNAREQFRFIIDSHRCLHFLLNDSQKKQQA